MAVLYNQASSHRLGVALIDLLGNGEWTALDVAVAWVRRSGTRHLIPAVRKFVQSGGIARFAVGIDIENTSVEGLTDLLSLSRIGDCKTVVCHNEAAVTFHPKVYLFRNRTLARLIVGSNNLTQAGLYTNTEASLRIDVPVGDRLIMETLTALDSWRDTSEGLAHVLDAAFLDELEDRGYVFREKDLARRRKSSKPRRGAPGTAQKSASLFSTKVVTAPAPPEDPATGLTEDQEPDSSTQRPLIAGTLNIAGHPDPIVVTDVLIMRVRPARGTQVQISIPLRNSPFFSGAAEVISGHDGRRHGISETRPERTKKEKINTFKVEIPETKEMESPVVRLEQSAQGITYYAYEGASAQGRPILESLREGYESKPQQTVLTKPSDPDHSTWYRFI